MLTGRLQLGAFVAGFALGVRSQTLWLTAPLLAWLLFERRAALDRMTLRRDESSHRLRRDDVRLADRLVRPGSVRERHEGALQKFLGCAGRLRSGIRKCQQVEEVRLEMPGPRLE